MSSFTVVLLASDQCRWPMKMYRDFYGHISPVRTQESAQPHASKFQPRRAQAVSSQEPVFRTHSYDVMPAYRGPSRFWNPPAYRRESRALYPSPAYRVSRSSSRASSGERLSWHSPRPRIPNPVPTERKTDLGRESHHRGAHLQPMFKHFQYPQKVPKIPEKIHRGGGRRGRVNTTVSDNEMRPSYSSHQTSRILTPESLSSGSEEELLYRANEISSESLSDPPSPHESGSEGEQGFGETMPIPPYQVVEENHYRSGDSSFRSSPKGSSHCPASDRSEKPAKKSKKKKRKPSKRRKRSPSDRSLSPLPEEELKEKRSHKARTPPSFKVKKPPTATSPPQYLPQPIIYQMPQPYPMPIPMYPPMPQFFYQPQMHPAMYQFPQYQPPPEPERRSIQTSRKEKPTQTRTPKATVQVVTDPSPTPVRANPSFVETLAEIDRQLMPQQSDDVKYPKSIALEIGIGESKSLADHFKEKLPVVNAKMTTRNNERAHREHKEKSKEELQEIRRELLKLHSPRLSTSQTSSAERINPVQQERVDRLAAGMSVVAKRAPESGEKHRVEPISPGGLQIIVKQEVIETVTVAKTAESPKPASITLTSPVSVKKEPAKKQLPKKEIVKSPPAMPNNEAPAKEEPSSIAEIRLKSVEEEKKEEKKSEQKKESAAGKPKPARTSRAPVKIQ